MKNSDFFVQVVISRLNSKATRERFLELTKEMYQWLLAQEGFISYEVFDNHPRWADKLVYQNKEAAERINKLFMETELAKNMLDLIEPGFTLFMGRPVSHQ